MSKRGNSSQKLKVQSSTEWREENESPINTLLQQHCRAVSLAHRNAYTSQINLSSLPTSVYLHSL